MFGPDRYPPSPGHITGIFIKLVETKDPFVQDPLAARQDWTSAVDGSVVLVSIAGQTPPEGRRPPGGPELDHLVVVVEGGGAPGGRVRQPAHHSPHDVPRQLQMFSLRRQLFS